MNKIVLLISFFLISILGVSQCTPLAHYADSTFGVWPDTVQNLPHATVNQAYFTTLYIKAPLNSSEFGFGAIPIDSLVIESISGMPSGFVYGCGNDDCAVPGGNHNCIYISGTPTQTGNFVLDITTRGYGGGFNLPYTFSGYKLVVDNATGIDDYKTDLEVFQNNPNPTNGTTIIKFNNKKPEYITLEVYDLLGKVIYKDAINSSVGKNSFSIDYNFIPGTYLYKVSSKEQSIVKKMTVNEF